METLTLPQGIWTYSTVKPLGDPGGFAAVYPGMSDTGDPVAIKVFHASDPAKARRELEFADQQLTRASAHVIPVLGCGIDPVTGRASIVMARADHSLAQKLHDDGPLDETATVAIARAVVCGLLEAGTWVHRDLKPANLLWCRGRWHVADFGIARRADASTALSTLKDFLTAPYAAPEQWNGERATHKTDVYALGCLLQEVMTGNPPFLGPDFDDYAEQHRLEAPKKLAGSERMRIQLARMLSKSPAARPELKELDQFFRDWDGALPANKGSAGLAQAAAKIAVEDLSRHAAVASADRQARDRETTQADALRELDDVSQALFDTIRGVAPNVSISMPRAKPSAVRVATLGNGELTVSVGQYRSIPADQFQLSGWDVLCGDVVRIEQGPGKGRSASLWYAQLSAEEPYDWYEVAYWSMGQSDASVLQPCMLPPGRDAALAASKIGHTWQLAHPPRSLRGPGRAQFIERWMEHLSAAAQGSFQRPANLPET
jgi:serine/threonine protein kinase